MKNLTFLLATLVVLIAFSSCGQKGPLYIEETTVETRHESQDETDTKSETENGIKTEPEAEQSAE